MLISRRDLVTAAPTSGHQLRSLARWGLLATTLVALMLITGLWSPVVEHARAGWQAGPAKPVLGADTGHASTGTSAGPARAGGSAAWTVPVPCTAEVPSPGASWPSGANLAGALGARAWWITTNLVADPVAGDGAVVETAEREVAQCADGYFDRWSQTWFNLRATPIAAVSFCRAPAAGVPDQRQPRGRSSGSL